MSTFETIIRKPAVILTAGLVLGGGLILASTNSLPRIQPTASAPSKLSPVALVEATSPALRDLDNALTSVVDAIRPGVVSISWNTGTQRGGEGTGFIYQSNGWIVTNEHVTGGRDEVDVTLSDGRKFKGKVTRANDVQYDLAMVKIEANNLPTLDFADSDSVKPGQIAIAIGSPFGLESSVTIGHISALGRTGQAMDGGSARAYAGLIQTDAAINPGNSGGPLLNIDGQVVGVNSMIYSNGGGLLQGSAGSVGVGFAISSKVASKVAKMLVEKGKLERAFLGAIPETLEPYRAKELNVPGGAYLRFSDQAPESPAKKAGMKDGDIVIDIDGAPVKTEIDVRLAMLGRAPGSKANVTFLRDGKRQTVAVTLAGVPKDTQAVQRPPQKPQSPLDDDQIPQDLRDLFRRNRMDDDSEPSNPASGARLGAKVSELDAAARKQFSIPQNVSGVAVMGFEAESIARDMGLEVGDVIVEANGKPIKSIDDLKASMNNSPTVSVKAERYMGGAKSTKTFTIK